MVLYATPPATPSAFDEAMSDPFLKPSKKKKWTASNALVFGDYESGLDGLVSDDDDEQDEESPRGSDQESDGCYERVRHWFFVELGDDLDDYEALLDDDDSSTRSTHVVLDSVQERKRALASLFLLIFVVRMWLTL